MRPAGFEGPWRVTHGIRGLTGGPAGRLTGTARFSPEGPRKDCVTRTDHARGAASGGSGVGGV